MGTPLLDTLALQTALTVWAAGDHLEACTVGGPEGRWADAAHRVVTEVLNGLGRRAGRHVPDAVDFAQIKHGKHLLDDVGRLRTDLDAQPIDYVQAEVMSSVLTDVLLKRTPTADPVTMVVNGLVYTEGRDFTVDRATRLLTWTATDLTITRDVAESVTVCFKTADREDAPLVDGYLSFV